MRAIWWRLAGCCLALVRGRANGGWFRATLLSLAAMAGLVLAGGWATGEAQEYSAY